MDFGHLVFDNDNNNNGDNNNGNNNDNEWYVYIFASMRDNINNNYSYLEGQPMVDSLMKAHLKLYVDASKRKPNASLTST